MKRRTSAFTMLELLIVLAIIAMLAGLSAPSLTQAMHSGKEAVSVQKLRQLHLALSMYRADQESSQDFGTIGEMGIPDWLTSRSALKAYGATADLWKSPCYLHRELHDHYPPIEYSGSTHPQFALETAVFESKSIMFLDMSCTSTRFSLLNQFHPKRGLAVSLSGQIYRKTAPGNYSNMRWWTPN